MDFNHIRLAEASGKAEYNEGLRSYMLKVYNYMCAALCITGLIAMFASSSQDFMSMLFNQGGVSGFGILIALAPIGLVFAMGLGLTRFSLQTLQMLYVTYSVLMGLSLSSIFLIYTGESIARMFFITAIVFGSMSLYGYTTKKDLTNFGSFLFMGLIGIIVLSLANMFLKSSGLMFVVSIAGLFIFIGLVAFETQKLRNIYFQLAGNEDGQSRMAIMGALNLYISFINIFITLLQLFGNRRD